MHGLGSQCVVDEDGRYAEELDHGLAGLSIMDAGKHVLGDSEGTANLYCNSTYPYWEGCVICSIYLR